MATEHDTPTSAVISIPGIGPNLGTTYAQLYDDQERRAQAIERAAAALVDADAAPVLAVADYVITGRNLFVEAE
ncbi:hypothetical protein [Microlunatus parietis]|uniref:Uncharacterized protein n=1 Tax=Microlunatus parietis TaxID=682979 RepID=A0A7Y9LAM8_9ACTN|nr:hypothetical protein [Microlunatus parietis]NYE68881.1 hypothetical protein [Microlunatus parietis]